MASFIYQFKITLKGIHPNIWRRIQVPGNYSFYDLHVAIQDSMGWSDYHLHQFEVKYPITGTKVSIGQQSSDFGFEHVIPEDDAKIARYFVSEKDKALYEYDFGDGWDHQIVFEKKILPVANVEYPRCVAGKRACPPEDCGGIWGYGELLQILANHEHKEYKEKMEWLAQFGNDHFDPEEFDPESINFDNPKERKDIRSRFF